MINVSDNHESGIYRAKIKHAKIKPVTTDDFRFIVCSSNHAYTNASQISKIELYQ